MSETFFKYCADTIRQEEHDFFLLAMLMPSAKREALFSVFAFNHEISKTRETVTETSIGLMRLLWWREAVQSIYTDDKAKEHPVLQALAKTIKEHDIPLNLFEDLTYAREFDLEDMQPANTQGLLNYCDFTHTPLFTICLKILSEDANIQNSAKAYALIKLLKDTVHYARQNRIYLPQDLCTKHHLGQDILSKHHKDTLQIIIKKIVEDTPPLNTANTPFIKALNAITKLNLKQLKAVDYDILNYRLNLPPFAKALRVWISTVL